MQPVGVVVEETVVGEALVDGQADVAEARNLHDALAAVVVDRVVTCVADNLLKQFGEFLRFCFNMLNLSHLILLIVEI